MTSDPLSLSAAAALPLGVRVRALQQQLPGLGGGSHFLARQKKPRISSGWPALDALLPGQGFLRGSLVEWLSEGPGSGAGTLALRVAQQASRPVDPQAHPQAAPIVVLDRSGWFYPPAAAAWGMDLQRLILLCPRDEASALWALDQALRCPAVAAVWTWLPRLEGRWFRRFQLAVEHSGCLGLLLRPAQVRGQPSWAEMQLGVQPQPSRSGRRWCVELLRCRGPGRLGQVEFQLDELSDRLPTLKKSGSHETHSLPLATPLAPPKAARRSTRA